VATCAAAALLLTACASGSSDTGSHASASSAAAAKAKAAAPDVHLSITPTAAHLDRAPAHGITVTAQGGRITAVTVHTAGDPVTGTLNSTGTTWHTTWPLDVSRHYTVTATAADPEGRPVTTTASFRTFTPSHTFSAEIIEGDQTYGVGMPIILYLSQPVTNRAAVERALQIRTSRRVEGAWYWDTECNTAPVCLYFRPRHYWPTHTRVTFTGHLNGVEAAPGLYGDHTLTQTFTIGDEVSVIASASGHYMDVFRNGRLFAHWPISSGRPGDDTPDGNYLTIEKSNPVDMIGPGYNLEVPFSVRFTWSGDYLHDAYWSVGEQGFTNVSHGCVNMSPADAQIFYNMAVPGDPVKVIGSPRAGVWDNGWTMWFLSWKQWVHGSALREAVISGPHGSTFISLHRRPAAAAAPAMQGGKTTGPSGPSGPTGPTSAGTTGTTAG